MEKLDIPTKLEVLRYAIQRCEYKEEKRRLEQVYRSFIKLITEDD